MPIFRIIGEYYTFEEYADHIFALSLNTRIFYPDIISSIILVSRDFVYERRYLILNLSTMLLTARCISSFKYLKMEPRNVLHNV